MIKVWTDAAEAGLLDRHGTRGSCFVYLPEIAHARAVSVTMPVRLPSWDLQFGLPPIFEMNLPEGMLRERLRLAFAKATGTFDEFDLLGIVGHRRPLPGGTNPLYRPEGAAAGGRPLSVGG
jgi:serine/threonine-protein kinase HipA